MLSLGVGQAHLRLLSLGPRLGTPWLKAACALCQLTGHLAWFVVQTCPRPAVRGRGRFCASGNDSKSNDDHVLPPGHLPLPFAGSKSNADQCTCSLPRYLPYPVLSITQSSFTSHTLSLSVHGSHESKWSPTASRRSRGRLLRLSLSAGGLTSARQHACCRPSRSRPGSH